MANKNTKKTNQGLTKFNTKHKGVRLITSALSLTLIEMMLLTGCGKQVEMGSSSVLTGSEPPRTYDSVPASPETTFIGDKISLDVDEKADISKLDFYINNYGTKNYLYLNDLDMLRLINQALEETEAEYIQIGATPVYDKKDNVFSYIDPYLILSMYYTETSGRLLGINNPDGSAYDISNYSEFYGYSKGIQYNGLGMMSQDAVTDVVNRDRRDVNEFSDYSHITVNGKKIEITFENINPYLYIIKSGAKTELEIKTALAENIMLTSKLAYIILNRNVKDYVRANAHDKELQKLNSYKELASLTQIERQTYLALLCYNIGCSDVIPALLDGTLFDKNEKGESLYNTRYGELILNRYHTIYQQGEKGVTR